MVDLVGPTISPAAFAAMVALVVTAVEDISTGRIGDDRIAAILTFGMVIRGGTGGLPEILAGVAGGAIVWGVCLLAIAAHARVRGQVGMGGGDAKLLSAIAVVFGAVSVGPTLMVASVAGMIVSLGRLAGGASVAVRQIAFGPYLVTVAVSQQISAWIIGEPWLSWVTR